MSQPTRRQCIMLWRVQQARVFRWYRLVGFVAVALMTISASPVAVWASTRASIRDPLLQLIAIVGVFIVVLVAALTTLCLVEIWLFERWARQLPGRRWPRCPRCGYDNREVDECPECGAIQGVGAVIQECPGRDA